MTCEGSYHCTTMVVRSQPFGSGRNERERLRMTVPENIRVLIVEDESLAEAMATYQEGSD